MASEIALPGKRTAQPEAFALRATVPRLFGRDPARRGELRCAPVTLPPGVVLCACIVDECCEPDR